MTMPAVASEPGPQVTRSQRWLARLSFLLLALAIAAVVVLAGLKSLSLLAVGVVGVAVSLAAAYVFLSRRGVLRWVAFAVFVLAPVAVIVVYAVQGLLAEAAILAAGWLLASMTARRRRRVDPDAHAGHLYGLPEGAARLGAARPPGSPGAEAPDELGQAATARRRLGDSCFDGSPMTGTGARQERSCPAAEDTAPRSPHT